MLIDRLTNLQYYSLGQNITKIAKLMLKKNDLGHIFQKK